MGVARPQRTEETENGTERLATSAEDVSYLAAFLFSLVQTSRKADERYDGVGVRDLVVMTVTVARASSADQSASERAKYRPGRRSCLKDIACFRRDESSARYQIH